jgi:hypothetical protein
MSDYMIEIYDLMNYIIDRGVAGGLKYPVDYDEIFHTLPALFNKKQIQETRMVKAYHLTGSYPIAMMEGKIVKPDSEPVAGEENE